MYRLYTRGKMEGVIYGQVELPNNGGILRKVRDLPFAMCRVYIDDHPRKELVGSYNDHNRVE